MADHPQDMGQSAARSLGGMYRFGLYPGPRVSGATDRLQAHLLRLDQAGRLPAVLPGGAAAPDSSQA